MTAEPAGGRPPSASILLRLSAWLPGGPSDLTVVSVDERWVKLLHAKGTSRARTVTHLLAVPAEGLTDDVIAARLREACQAQGIDPANVIVCNPAHLTTTRLFAVPSSDWAEIRDIVELQAEKHTPYAKEEILSDFQMVETDTAGYSRVMLIISHQDVVRRGVQIVEAAGWPLERVAFELDGLVGWFRAYGGDAKTPAMVVEIDGDTTTVVVIQGGKPYFHRSLPFGVAQLMTEPAGSPSRLVEELRRSLDALEADHVNLTVATIILTGQIERLPDLQGQIQKELNLPTNAVAPFERVAVSEPAASARREITQVSFASLVGLATQPVNVDLTPKPLRLHRVFELRARALVALGCQGIAALLLISAIVIAHAHRNERYHAWLNQEYRRSGEEADRLAFDLKELGLVDAWLGARGELLNALLTLSRNTSDAIRWDSLDFSRGDRIVVKGVSRDMPKIYEMVTALKQSPYFSEVEARRVTKRREGEEDLTSFEVTCTLRPPAEAPGQPASPEAPS